MRSLALGAALLLAGGAQAGETGSRSHELRDPALYADDLARHRMKYLASCALREGERLTGTQAGETYEFPGSLGLAPDWAEAPLSATGRRWVSACVLARTNFFGANVLVSMRADPPPVESLAVMPEEVASHTLYEGGYFGDIFADPPRAYVCASPEAAATEAARERRKRVCATPSESVDGLSRCGFVMVAPCVDGTPPLIDGEPWPEVIHIWLDGAEPE